MASFCHCEPFASAHPEPFDNAQDKLRAAKSKDTQDKLREAIFVLFSPGSEIASSPEPVLSVTNSGVEGAPRNDGVFLFFRQPY
jgi:hypothetical protein